MSPKPLVRLSAKDTEKVFEAKKRLLGGLGKPPFCRSILEILQIKSLELYNVELEPGKDYVKRKANATAVTVHEITANADMLNAKGSVHGACWALLLDVCSSFAIGALGSPDSFHLAGITADMQQRYLAPAFPGDVLTITSTTIMQSQNTAIVETRVTNASGRLLFVGVHRKANVDKPRQSKL